MPSWVSGTTNDRAAVVAAITDAASSGVLSLPSGKIRNTGPVIPLPPGMVVRGSGATVWDGPGFELTADNRVEDIGFTGVHATTADYAVSTRSTSAATDCTITRCVFTSYPGPAVNLRAAPGAGATRCHVTDNTFTNNGYAIYMESGSHCRISGNTSKNQPATGRHFAANAAQGCEWTNNTTEGGVTGVLLLAAANVAQRKPLAHNVIAGNQIRGASEEGISLDSAANAASTTCVIDWGTVSAKTFNAAVPGGQLGVTLDGAFAGVPAGRFYGYHLIVTTGAATGAVLSIDGDNGGTTLYCNNTRRSVYTALAAGDEVVIGNPMVGNTITHNTIEDAGTYSVLVWGLGVGNVVGLNSCYSSLASANVNTGGPAGGVEVWGLDGLVRSTSAFTSRLGRAPAVGNRVHHNTLNRCDVRFAVNGFSGPGFALSASNVRSDNVLVNADTTT